jgi:cytochrome c553
MRYPHSLFVKMAPPTLAAVFILSVACGPALAGDARAGHDKARQCQVCHGLDGLAKLPDAPHIAGDSAIYIEMQLKAYRSGERTHPQMSIVAQALSDEDISDLAAYYSAIEVTVKVPEL